MPHDLRPTILLVDDNPQIRSFIKPGMRCEPPRKVHYVLRLRRVTADHRSKHTGEDLDRIAPWSSTGAILLLVVHCSGGIMGEISPIRIRRPPAAEKHASNRRLLELLVSEAWA